MRLQKLLLLITATLSLSACQETLNTAFDRIEGTWDSILEAPSKPKAQRINGDPASAFSEPCPKINVVKELSILNEFTEPDNPKDSKLVSHAGIEQLESTCSLEGRNVIIDLKLAVKSKLGKKAKIRDTDKPFFAYPFFVAISDNRGTVLAKEVFSAAISYDSNETSHTHYENIRQIIPIGNRSAANSYKVYIGFQLSDEQLAYNRKTMAPPPMIPLEHAIDTDAAANTPEPLHSDLQTEE